MTGVQTCALPILLMFPSHDIGDFIETLCTHVEGELAGKPFILEKWQEEEIIRPLFGWKRKDGSRKYRSAWIEIPRKQGKTTISSAISLYLLFGDGEAGAQIYNAAASKEQARLGFNISKQMIKQNPILTENCEIFENSIVLSGTNSFLKAISAEAYCMRLDTLLDMADGSRKKVDDIKIGDKIMGWYNGKPKIGNVISKEYQHPSNVFRIKTHRNREIFVTENHQFLVMKRGRRLQDLTHEYEWIKAIDLKKDDRISIGLGWDGEDKKANELEMWALGAWAGDGECGRFRFINIDLDIINAMRIFIDSIGGRLVSAYSTRQKQKGDVNSVCHEHIIMGNGRGRKSEGREWIRKHFGQDSRAFNKRIPLSVFNGGGCSEKTANIYVNQERVLQYA